MTRSLPRASAARSSTVPPAPRLEDVSRWRTPGAVDERSALIAQLASGDTPPRDLRGIRLVGEKLPGVDFSGVDLTGADLSRADLTGARFVGANLSGAILAEATLTSAELAGATLHGAHLDGVDARQAGFGQADLRRTSLFSARLDGASLVSARLRHADLRDASLSGARLTSADLSHAALGRAVLTDADLSHARVTGASFVESDLRRARMRSLVDFEHASFLRADVRDVDFSGAYLLRHHILDENFLDEFRSQSGMHQLLYFAWWVSSDCGRSLLRWSAWIVLIAGAFGVGFSFAPIDYGAHETWLSPFYYSVVTLTSLGYGDVLPTTAGGQALAMAEVTLGYLMLGGLISIFANKLARRGE